MAYTRDVDTLAMINQTLDVLGKRKQRVAAAGEGVVRSQADYELARWQVAQRVKLAYWAGMLRKPRPNRRRSTSIRVTATRTMPSMWIVSKAWPSGLAHDRAQSSAVDPLAGSDHRCPNVSTLMTVEFVLVGYQVVGYFVAA
jgi:hypothetical protein